MARHLTRSGRAYRVADPGWADPLDPHFSAMSGGRWNPPGSFGVVYFNVDFAAARANVARLYRDTPYGPEDLDPATAPLLIDVELPAERYADAGTKRGLASLRLPATYPDDGQGAVVDRTLCQAIGTRLFTDGELGVACRSAAALPSPGEELAWFAQAGRAPLDAVRRRMFEEWFW